jgi:hypothetical protein
LFPSQQPQLLSQRKNTVVNTSNGEILTCCCGEYTDDDVVLFPVPGNEPGPAKNK